MATSKLLKPTNVTISIPGFTDQPDQRVNSNCIDKEADAINSLSDHIANKVNLVKSGYANNDTVALDRNKYYLLVGGNEYWTVNLFLVYDNGWRKKGTDSDSKISFSGDSVVIGQYIRYLLMSN